MKICTPGSPKNQASGVEPVATICRNALHADTLSVLSAYSNWAFYGISTGNKLGSVQVCKDLIQLLPLFLGFRRVAYRC